MNYVILNGINSSTKTGLLIQSLPSISKPQIRTRVEEIDGRDGDIITKLGYASYDRTMSIGLYGNYDIDEIIAFFDSEGTVIFSNEPDKYYRYQILKQVDFEKLLRFRTATVTFHVQPFKYAAEESAVVLTGTGGTIVNSGNTIAKPILTLTGSKAVIELYMNGVQMLQITFGDYTSITIDSEAMEAYSGTVLVNRQVVGDYSNLNLSTGENTITWAVTSGSLSQVEVSNYSRWI